ncbi:glycerophosphoryl diester phosphodiesterase membrane domain-containing protein [Curtobacterium sp. ODYSSEY 48 V2]|uniref:glycerophosphoryl diester phosphodiesterase membrane domain-containing protein n=1 Tax=Curtobacterium sp. ODYSSEY 48 V2 TaxID=2939561 RepID=UPI00203D9BFF|nr:glycerophosphoryl diester phosphodiesterase membrane domain-containing protein [Curtobacterium sp. ODYSSEY 48 V2]MCM3506288.1 glycerophosphoryl diester phosphodiesterase membrane domain-containing protein [Curtobacterium sp. ODYSSEY 48 V2]
MADWQVPGSGGGEDRTGGPSHPAGQPSSAGWSGQQPWPAQQGWQQHAGPGRPGPGPQRPPAQRPVVPLRPLGLGDVLAGAFTVFRRNPRVLLLWSLLLSGVLGLLATLASTFGQQSLQARMSSAVEAGGSGAGDVVAGSVTLFLVLSVGLPFLAYLGRAFLVAPVAADTGQRVLGRRASFRGLWALLAGRRWPVLAWILLQLAAGLVLGAVFGGLVVGIAAGLVAGRSGIGGFIGAFFLLALGALVVVAWLATRFAFTVPTIALEGRGVFSAAAQSWRLTRGAFWRTFGIVLLVQVTFGIAGSIASIPLTFGTVLAIGAFDPLGQTGAAAGVGVGAVVAIVLGALLSIAVQCVTDVLSASVLTFLALDRRIRTEALDQRIAAHLDTGEPSDPFAPAPAVARPPWPGQQGPGQQGPGQPWPGQPSTQQWPGPQQPTQQWPGPQQPSQQWPGQPWPGGS